QPRQLCGRRIPFVRALLKQQALLALMFVRLAQIDQPQEDDAPQRATQHVHHADVENRRNAMSDAHSYLRPKNDHKGTKDTKETQRPLLTLFFVPPLCSSCLCGERI